MDNTATHVCRDACGMHISVIFHVNIRVACRAKRLPPVALQPGQPLANPPTMPLVAAGNVRHRPGPLAPPKTVTSYVTLVRGTSGLWFQIDLFSYAVSRADHRARVAQATTPRTRSIAHSCPS